MSFSGAAKLLGVLAIVLSVAGAGLANLRIMQPAAGFGLFMLGLLLGLVAFVLACFAIARAGKLGVPRRNAAAGFVLGLLVVFFVTSLIVTRGFRTTPQECSDLPSCAMAGVDAFYAAAYRPAEFATEQLREFSPINDISTDLDNPPEFTVAPVKGGDWSLPDASRQRQPEAYPDITTVFAGGQPTENYPIVLDVAREKGWTILVQRPDFFAFEATAETGMFRFVDDISVRMYASPRCPRPMNGRCNSTAVDIRSKSRDGVSDIGKNAARIREFTRRIRELTVESAPPREPTP